MTASRLPSGTLLQGRYRILDIIGEGAMSTVYRVEDLTVPGARWAVKELRIANATQEEAQEALQLFMGEAQILKDLDHPGIPFIFDFFSVSCLLSYLVMEYIEGATLSDIIEKSQAPFTEEALLPLMLQISSCLRYLHGRSPHPVIFRDLKPSNIIVNREGKIKLVDFGIARLFSPAKTKDTCIIGTPGFCAPEQYGTSQTDVRSDIYSLGATMYFLLTYRDTAQYHFEFPEVTAINPDVTPGMERILQRCLQREPEKRFQSMEDLHHILMAHLRALVPGSAIANQRVLRGDWRFFRNWFLRTFVMKAGIARRKTGKLAP